MIIALLKTRLRHDASTDQYATLGGRMYEIVSAMPGFISAEFFNGEGGYELTVARFESEDALAAWRNEPEHLAAQQRGLNEFYSSVSVQVCELTREYERHATATDAVAPVPA